MAYKQRLTKAQQLLYGRPWLEADLNLKLKK